MKNAKHSHFSGLIKKSGLAIIATAFVLTASITQADFKPAVVMILQERMTSLSMNQFLMVLQDL